MNEYPSIINASRAPHLPCIAFEKYDGKNVRVKYTQKRGFYLYGTRTQLFDVSHPEYGQAVRLFEAVYREPLERLIAKRFPNVREVDAFGELYSENSFAGILPAGEEQKFMLFDLLVGHKNAEFIAPQELIRLCGDRIPLAREVYRGNMGTELIRRVRAGDFNVKEGVVCKGTQSTAKFFGGIWMCKIKTQAYLDRLFARWGEEGLNKFGE